MFLTELLLMILLMLVLPTVDVGTDLRIAIIWFSTRRNWSLSVFCALIGQTACSAVLWFYLEPPSRRKYSWVLVIFQVFPQYRAVFIIYNFVRKSSDANAKETRMVYDQKISTIEPYVESMPQVIILTASFFSAWGKLTGNLDDKIAMEQITGTEDVSGIRGWFDIPVFFYVSYGLLVSLLLGASPSFSIMDLFAFYLRKD